MVTTVRDGTFRCGVTCSTCSNVCSLMIGLGVGSRVSGLALVCLQASYMTRSNEGCVLHCPYGCGLSCKEESHEMGHKS